MKSNKAYQKLFKATMATTLAAGAFVTTAPLATNAEVKALKDMDSKQDYYKDVLNLLERGIVSGFPDGTYQPYKAVTRGQAAKIIAGVLDLDTKNVKDPGFTDVKKTDEYYGAIAALAEAGIISGYPDKTFKQSETLTRGQMAKIISIGFGLEEEELKDDNPFTDVKPTNEYAKYIQALLSNGITKGTTATTFAPSDSVKRGQLASFVVRSEAVQPFVLSIMHFNDTHAHLDDIAKRVTAVKEHRAEKPDALLLDAGDVFSGTLYFNEFKGQADLEFMNLMKVDAMTFGNHEFDLGSSPEGHQALVDFIKAAQFPFVSSNIDFSKDEKFTGLFNTKISTSPENSNIYSGIVKEVKGEKIGIFGLTTAETADISSPGAIEFSNYIEEAKKMVAEFEKMGVNKIVAITHIGFDDNPNVDNDLELAKAVEGIDVIVGGHSHTKLDKPVVVDSKAAPTIIVQTGQYGENLGTLDVQFDKDGVVTKHDGKLIKVADKVENPEAAELLKKYADKIKEIKTTEIGATALAKLETPRAGDDKTAPSVRKNETPLGNIITDGMLAKAKEYDKNVIMALQNGGGIRAAIDEGPITIGQVITVLPFGNTLATMNVTGAEIKAAFEISFKEYPGENGGFLHVSGAKVEFDSSKEVGQRVVSVKYFDGENYVDLEDDKTYTIATNAFTAKGGDGYDVFKKAYAEGRVTDLGLSDWENLAEQLKKLGDITPKVEGRIVDVATN